MKLKNKLLFLIKNEIFYFFFKTNSIVITISSYFISILLFKFSILTQIELPSILNISFIWIIFYYTSIISISLFFFNNSVKELLFYKIRPYYYKLFLISKIISFLIINIIPLFFCFPIFFIFLNINLRYFLFIFYMFVLSTITMSFIGLLISLLNSYHTIDKNSNILSILILPLFLPSTIFTIDIINCYIYEKSYIFQFNFLILYNSILILLIIITYFFIKKA